MCVAVGRKTLVKHKLVSLGRAGLSLSRQNGLFLVSFLGVSLLPVSNKRTQSGVRISLAEM